MDPAPGRAPRRRRIRLPGILPELEQVRYDDRPLDARDVALLSDLQVNVDDNPPPEPDAEAGAGHRKPRTARIVLWATVLLGSLLLVGMAVAGMQALHVRAIEYIVYGLLLAILGVALLRRLRA